MKQYLAIDIGGTAVKLGIVDETGAVGSKAEESVNFDGYQTPVLTTVLKAAKAFVETQNIDVNTLEGVGVSATGQIDSRKGIVAGTCGNFPNYIGSPIKAALEKDFGLPVTVANDANCMTLGEVWVGGAKGYTDVIGVTLGTGVGGGILTGGRLLEGARGLGGELGHFRTHALDGVLCTCGASGCWERYASATALKRMTAEALAAHPDSGLARVVAENDGHVSGQSAFIAAREGDPVGQAVCDRYVNYLACGVINVVNIFQPDTLAIGGGVSNEAEEQLLLPVQQRVARESIPCGKDRRTRIVKAQLGNRAGLIGAALLGKNKRI